MKRLIQGENRTQGIRLPECLDDYGIDRSQLSTMLAYNVKRVMKLLGTVLAVQKLDPQSNEGDGDSTRRGACRRLRSQTRQKRTRFYGRLGTFWID